MEKPKIKIHMQGKIIVEKGEDGVGWLVMFPDGQIYFFESRKEVEKVTKKWFSHDANKDKIGLGITEWRD